MTVTPPTPMARRMGALALATLVSATTWAAALTGSVSDADYQATRDRIAAEYSLNRDRCDALKGNLKDVCVAEAKGLEQVARAELEAAYKPSVEHAYAVRETRADAQLAIAREKCDALAGNAKDVCLKDAKAAHVTAMADARVARADMETRLLRTDRMAAAERTAMADKLNAEFAAAKQRCNDLASATRDACVADAKARLGLK